MEKTLISWSVPNMITIWLMLAIGFLILSLAVQFGMKWTAPAAVASTAGGY
jgi:hypothetical protein